VSVAFSGFDKVLVVATVALRGAGLGIEPAAGTAAVMLIAKIAMNIVNTFVFRIFNFLSLLS
jgi:hypothetical protein